MEEQKSTDLRDVDIHSRKHRDKLLFLMFAGAISIGLLVIGGFQLIEFSDSTAFCGRLCHDVMYPEYTAYQASPHSRVTCSACHVGPGAGYLVKSKVSGVPMIAATITGNYDRPIPTPVENLRPARETCEQCHRPERFAGDIVRTHTTYGTDEKNTPKTDTRVLRVGGGETEIAKDIHWHSAAKVWYLPMDKARQEIIWVGVEGKDGVTEYIDPANANKISVELVQEKGRLMDCMDCHNRATHVFQSPQELIDQAMARGKIDGSLPYIKREGLKVLDPPNTSLMQANSRIEAIRDFYRNNYPQVYATRAAVITAAIAELKEVARLTTFPEMNVTWKSYVDNAGHQDSPGCLRCHGKLVATSGETKGKPIDADCKACHYLQL